LGAHNLKVEHGSVVCLGDKNSDAFSNAKSGLITMEGQREVEKNWVMFEDSAGVLKIIYNWHDLVIGDLVSSPKVAEGDNQEADEGDDQEGDQGYTFQKTNTIKTPPIFKYFRGSTNGIRIGDEIWFICHVVSYEDRRYYYHVFVTLDATTYEVRQYTPLFTFDGEKVEYTLGFVYREDGSEQDLQKESSETGTKFSLQEPSAQESSAQESSTQESPKSDGEFWIGFSKMDRSTHFMSIKKSAIEELMV
jgi:hypothetical protein